MSAMDNPAPAGEEVVKLILCSNCYDREFDAGLVGSFSAVRPMSICSHCSKECLGYLTTRLRPASPPPSAPQFDLGGAGSDLLGEDVGIAPPSARCPVCKKPLDPPDDSPNYWEWCRCPSARPAEQWIAISYDQNVMPPVGTLCAIAGRWQYPARHKTDCKVVIAVWMAKEGGWIGLPDGMIVTRYFAIPDYRQSSAAPKSCTLGEEMTPAIKVSLEQAIWIASEAHSGQLDKGGQPYILHPLRVMLAMNTNEERAVAVLHDVVEDTDVSLEEIADALGAEVAEGVDAVTRRSGESYPEYITRAGNHPIGRKVKIADLYDNLDPARLAQLTSRTRLENKYRGALAQLGLIPSASAPDAGQSAANIKHLLEFQMTPDTPTEADIIAAPSAPASAARELSRQDVHAKWMEYIQRPENRMRMISTDDVARFTADLLAEQTRHLREELGETQESIAKLYNTYTHEVQRAQAAEAERDKLRDLLKVVSGTMTNNLSLVEFYAKREIESPSNGEEAVRETREQLREYRKAEETLRAALDRLRKEAK